jgi:hypothetical protein
MAIVLLSDTKQLKFKKMKTKITLLGVISLFIGNSLMAQYDMAIGNISAGWNTYNQSTSVITGVYFDVLNNENNNPGSFDVKVYLVDPNNSSISYAVWTYTDSDGQGGNTVVTYDNLDIDFDDTPGIPAGQYRLAVCVDPDNNISETDENNNCLYISSMGNNLTYSPGSAGIVDLSSSQPINIYPNPVDGFMRIDFGASVAEMNFVVMDLSGKVIKSTMLSSSTSGLDMTAVASGLYVYQVMNKDGKTMSTGKIVKK